jgi:phage-related baseplate assembly protein
MFWNRKSYSEWDGSTGSNNYRHSHRVPVSQPGYSVGQDHTGRIKLTITADTGTATTMTMSPQECKRLISMLQSTVDVQSQEDTL